MRPAGVPVRGSSLVLEAAGVEVLAVVVGAVVLAGVVVAAGALVAGVVVVDCVVVVLLGVVGAASGSWYCSSPAPSANAAAGVSARLTATAIVVMARRGIASLVADASGDSVVRLRAWLSRAGWR
jgi:hypothetical protein